eukprot:gene5216-18444_t
MGIGYPADMFFNNMWCDQVVMTTPVPNAKQLVAVPELSLDEMPQDLSVSYFPITLSYGTPEGNHSAYEVGGGDSIPFVSSFTQMYIEISNTGSNTSVNLDKVTLQYWFDAPLGEGSTQELKNYSDIASVQFAFTCSDTSPILSEFNVVAVQFALTCSDISTILSEFNAAAIQFTLTCSDTSPILSEFNVEAVQFDLTCSDISPILSEFNATAVQFALTCSDTSPILSEFNATAVQFALTCSEISPILSEN